MITSRTKRVTAYFSAWVILALVCIVLNALNVDWDRGEETCLVVLRPLSGSGQPGTVALLSGNATTDSPAPNGTTMQAIFNDSSDSSNSSTSLWEMVCSKPVKTHIAQGIVLVIVLGIIQGSVLEFPVMTITTLILGGGKRAVKMADATGLTIVLNYNILALSRDDIDECLTAMYEAYMGNLAEEVSAVLVSATNDEDLKQYELEVRDKYRAVIYDTLFREGSNFAAGDLASVDPLRLEKVWDRYTSMDRDLFVSQYLDGICDEFAREFMVLHRVSRVLRKCGQYQDLMLLSEGETEGYSYTDPAHYGRQARHYGEPLFHPSPDVDNVINRKFDYTLVLDGDTGVVKGSVFEMLKVAAAHPDRGIIQPAIRLHCDNQEGTLFMHLETMRQEMYEPMTNAMTAMLGQSSYFGKALIKNSVYIHNVIGTRENLIERVPVDVLSHDTFEAALLRPLFCSTVHLLEAPSYNYVSWNIRERRWNRGEVLLAMYFWPRTVGVFLRWVQSKVQGDKFNATKLRTESKLDFVTSYIAHSALRQMMMKPLLLVYILINYNSVLIYRWSSIIIVMFILLVFPKLATCNRRNYRLVLLETVASLLQFTPEAVVGCVRIVRAVHANIVVQAKWVPQRAVEEQFKQSNPFLSSLRQLWGYSAVALVAGVLVSVFLRDALLIMAMLVSLFLLPFYTGFTSLTKGLKSARAVAANKAMLQANTLPTVAAPDLKSQTLKGTPGFVSAFTNLGFVSETDSAKLSKGWLGTGLGQRTASLQFPRPRLYPRLAGVAEVELLETILDGNAQDRGAGAADARDDAAGARTLAEVSVVSMPAEGIEEEGTWSRMKDLPYAYGVSGMEGRHEAYPAALFPSSRLQPSAPPASGSPASTLNLSRATVFSHRSFQSQRFYLLPPM